MSLKDVVKGRSVDERLTAQAVAMRNAGKKQEEIAVALGVAQGTVSVILRQHGLGGHLVKWAPPNEHQG